MSEEELEILRYVDCSSSEIEIVNKAVDTIKKIQQENTQLKRMLNIKEKFDKKEVPYEWEFKDMFDMREENENLRATIKNDDVAVNNLCKEIENLKQQLIDKDEKINKSIGHINACCGEDGMCKDELKYLKEILESNKED